MSGKPRRRDTMASKLLRLREQIAALFNDHEHEKQELQQHAARAEQERREEVAARQADQARYEHERAHQILALLRKMGQGRPFILDILQEGQDADSAATLRDARAELVRWIQEVSGQRLSRFPTESEAPGGLLTLSLNELADPDRGFDVGNERPFADGQREVAFRLIRTGWRLGSQVLHPARLSAFEVPQAVQAEKEGR